MKAAASPFTGSNTKSTDSPTPSPNLGLQPGQRVAFMDVNTPELIQTYLACAQLDAIFVPLNYRARAHEVSQMLQLCDPTLFIVGHRYQDLVDSVIQDSPSLRHVIALEQRPTHDWLFFDDLISSAPADELHYPSSADTDTTLLLFTSGTTGAPKAVKLTHQSFSSYMLSSVTPADPEVEERNLLSLPMYHVAGIQSALAAIYGGRTLLLARQFEAQQWMELVQREKAYRAGMVPTMLKQVLDHPRFPDYDLSSLRVISYGAAPMPPEVIQKAIQIPPSRPVYQRVRTDGNRLHHHHAIPGRPRVGGRPGGGRETAASSNLSRQGLGRR